MRRNLASLVLVTKKGKQAQSVRKQFFQKIAAGFGLASVILVLIGVVSYQNTIGSTNNRSIAKKTYQKIKSLDQLLFQIKNAQTGENSYIVSGEKIYLKPYQTALNNVDQEIANLKSLTADQPNQRQQ
ncbi:MAG: CHASE3 domain-containing protein, partial [Nostoc sp.]